MELYMLLKDTSKVKRTGENVCASRVGGCNAVYHRCERSCWLMSVSQHVCFCGVRSVPPDNLGNPISHTKQNNGAFTTWILHSTTCMPFSARVSTFSNVCTVVPFKQQGPKCFPINLTKTINPTRWCFRYIPICIWNANVTLCILARCLV